MFLKCVNDIIVVFGNSKRFGKFKKSDEMVFIIKDVFLV